jgi:mannose-6-phosphate isomerase-like protein (cupin superfamily)
MLSAKECRNLQPRMFAVNHGAQEKLSGEIAAMLDPVRTDAMHFWSLTKAEFPELHYHAHDEYWMWAKGRTTMRIRLPDGRQDTFEVGPGWIMYLVRGVEHCHTPLKNWQCYELHGLYRNGVGPEHLHRL